MEEDWGTGTVTAMKSKSSTSIHIILPAGVIRYIGGVEDRDILRIKVLNTHSKQPKRYAGAKNFKRLEPVAQESNDTSIVPTNQKVGREQKEVLENYN